jgi:hypothetical protein
MMRGSLLVVLVVFLPGLAIGAPPESKDSPMPATGAGNGGPARDLQSLRAEYDRLRDELARTRARAQIVQEAIHSAKLSATFRWDGAPDYVIHRAEMRLDGGELWDSGGKPISGDLIKVAERGVKPGPHALTVRIEIRPGKKTKDADKYGYVSEHTFAIQVPDKMTTRLEITGDEDGDPPEYEPEIEVEIESEK